MVESHAKTQSSSRQQKETIMNTKKSKKKLDTAQQSLADQREYVQQRQLDEQRAYVGKVPSGSGLVDESVLAQSMRSVRYADEAHAAGDVIDNAIEAGATQVHIFFRTRGTKIQEIAFVDDGSGILAEFLPHAVKWGGSSNVGKRNIFGRFGFGLPSASVNRGTAFEVYSRTSADQPFLCVGIDTLNLQSKRGVVPLPTTSEAEIPEWVSEYIATTEDEAFEGGHDAVRTVVIWKDLDRLEWPNRDKSTAQFLEHIGITYADWLSSVRIAVNGRLAEPTDVLFTTPDFRFNEIEGFPKAEPQSTVEIPVTNADGKHQIRVRFSYIGIDANNATVAVSGGKRLKKVRQAIRKQYDGFFVTRNGRFVEVARPRTVSWSVYSRQVGVAVDFPPELDELFGVTPDKQSIVLGETVLGLFEKHGVNRIHRDLVKQVAAERKQRKAEADAESDGKRPSEEAMERSVDVRRHARKQPTETAEEADRNFKEKVQRASRETGVPEEAIAEAKEEEAIRRPYVMSLTDGTPDDPFYIPLMEGAQLVVQLNTEHPFYKEVYSRFEPHQAELRSGLEVLLFVLAQAELDQEGKRRAWYREERPNWSHHLAIALDIHPEIFNKLNRVELDELDPDQWTEDDEAA